MIAYIIGNGFSRDLFVCFFVYFGFVSLRFVFVFVFVLLCSDCFVLFCFVLFCFVLFGYVL